MQTMLENYTVMDRPIRHVEREPEVRPICDCDSWAHIKVGDEVFCWDCAFDRYEISRIGG